jgi:hypothetical protein
MEAFLKGGKLGKVSSAGSVAGAPGPSSSKSGGRRRGPVPWVEK